MPFEQNWIKVRPEKNLTKSYIRKLEKMSFRA